MAYSMSKHLALNLQASLASLTGWKGIKNGLCTIQSVSRVVKLMTDSSCVSCFRLVRCFHIM
jgi:hypothetical protein